MNRRSTPTRRFQRRAVLATLTLGLSLAPALCWADGVAAAAHTSVNVVGLKPGATGPDVQALQQALIAAGVPVKGGADGVYGKEL